MVVMIENILESTGSYISAKRVINHPKYAENDKDCKNIYNDVAVLEVRVITINITTTTPIHYLSCLVE